MSKYYLIKEPIKTTIKCCEETLKVIDTPARCVELTEDELYDIIETFSAAYKDLENPNDYRNNPISNKIRKVLE